MKTTLFCVLLYATHIASASAQCVFAEDFNDSATWHTWTSLGQGSLSLQNNQVQFAQTQAGYDNRLYKALPCTLSGFPWRLTFECNPTDLHNSVGPAFYLALTANANDGQCLPYTQVNTPLAWTNNTVLRVTYDSEYGATNNCGFNVQAQRNVF
jgi:hypothetical protein